MLRQIFGCMLKPQKPSFRHTFSPLAKKQPRLAVSSFAEETYPPQDESTTDPHKKIQVGDWVSVRSNGKVRTKAAFADGERGRVMKIVPGDRCTVLFQGHDEPTTVASWYLHVLRGPLNSFASHRKLASSVPPCSKSHWTQTELTAADEILADRSYSFRRTVLCSA